MVFRNIASVLRPRKPAAAESAPVPAAPVTIKIGAGESNNNWNRAARGRHITVKKEPVITKDAKIFAMGSCFAMEIRSALRAKGFEVYPKYFDIQFNPETQKPGGLPEKDSIANYDTFTIRQEFEQAFARAYTTPGDFWKVDSLAVKRSVGMGTKELWQDPHRRRIFADSQESLLDISRKLDDCIGGAIREADVYIITLGLIEVWKNKRNGKWLCMAPGREQMDDAEFILSDFESNLNNMRAVCELVKEHAPGKKIILTVSPVALQRTFTEKDVVVANMESKSLLRTVAGQIDREYDNVLYWPSYEIAAYEDIFEEDGRHVLKSGVDKIISAFIEAHCAQ